MKVARLTPEFVEFIPETLEDGKLYISEEYKTAVHKCCCGCGLKVVTPLKPSGWRLTRDGDFVTIYPSIGNWSFPCQSHYWIRRNLIWWSYHMTREEIEAGRRYDARVRKYYQEMGEVPDDIDEFIESERPREPEAESEVSFWQKLKDWFSG